MPLREALYRATEGLSGKAYDKALKDFSDTGSHERDRNGDPLFQKIRRVRVREALSVIPIKDKAGRAYKAYKGSANDRFEIWRMPDGKWQSEVITTFEAHQAGAPDRRPHPAAKKVLSLKQNDVIAIERDSGARELMVVKQIWPKQVSLVGHLESGNLMERHRNEEDRFRFFSPTAGGLKKLRARQVRIDPLGRIFDPGPR